MKRMLKEGNYGEKMWCGISGRNPDREIERAFYNFKKIK